MEFIFSMIGFALKLLGIAAGFAVFFYILRNGRAAFKDLLETIGIGIQTLCIVAKRKLVDKLKKEALLEEEKDSTEVEAHVI